MRDRKPIKCIAVLQKHINPSLVILEKRRYRINNHLINVGATVGSQMVKYNIQNNFILLLYMHTL